ncbi:MAG: hypothetical protein HYR63_09380 [Proteobacteria bacterium]|nr:hypothetical protein [Pseudomonadota bacterium]MBI3497524.1 hypothetical protein [Pseudomonadota bacterium]
MAEPLSRRHFLSAWSILTVGAIARPAAALTNDTLSPAAQASYLNACSQREQDFHKQLLAQVEATLDGRRLSQEEKDRIRAATTCPLCGCPVFAS